MITETKFNLWIWDIPFVAMCKKARETAGIVDGDFVKITAENGNSIIRQVFKVPLAYLREANQSEHRDVFIRAIAVPKSSAYFLFTNRIEDFDQFFSGISVEKTDETMPMP